MSNELQIYRKRLIPEECILLKDDIIVEQNEDYILTKWKTLNPKTTFSHGCSCYYLKEGFKISKFYRHDGSLLYWYCDIVEYTSRPEDNSLIVTDLLADIILYPDGRMHVVDLDELAEAAKQPFYEGLARLAKASLEGIQSERALDVAYPRFYR